MKVFSTKSVGALALAAQAVPGADATNNGFDVFKYVDPLIGTSNGGENRLRRFLFVSNMTEQTL